MSSKWVKFGLLGVSAVLWLVACWVATKTVVPMAQTGAAVTDSGWMAQLVAVLGASGFSVATVVAFLKTNAPQILESVASVLPKSQNSTVIDTVELASAVAAYLANKTDVNLKQRVVVAMLSELSDVIGKESPTVAKEISDLGSAWVATCFVAPPTPTAA